MPAGHVAPEDVIAGTADRVGRGHPEQSLTGRVQPHDPAVVVDLEDQVCRAFDHRGELLPLALECLTQARALERDRKLVTGQLDHPDPIGVGEAMVDGPEAQEDDRRLIGDDDSAAARQPDGPDSTVAQVVEVDRKRRRGLAADRGKQVQAGCLGGVQPERSSIDGGQPDSLERDGPSKVGRGIRPTPRAG